MGLALYVPVVESSRCRIFVICRAKLDFYDHYVPLTELSLGEVMTETGFTLEDRFPVSALHDVRGQPPVWMLRLYLKLTFAWPLFGKQFLVVGK